MSKSFYHTKTLKNALLFLLGFFLSIEHVVAQRSRARDIGVEIGIFKPGKWNSITDVNGVTVGHSTLIRGKSVRTGVTIIKPHEGDLFKEKVTAAVHVINGFGKAIGFTQVEELGTIETPIALTNTCLLYTSPSPRD